MMPLDGCSIKHNKKKEKVVIDSDVPAQVPVGAVNKHGSQGNKHLFLPLLLPFVDKVWLKVSERQKTCRLAFPKTKQ